MRLLALSDRVTVGSPPGSARKGLVWFTCSSVAFACVLTGCTSPAGYGGGGFGGGGFGFGDYGGGGGGGDGGFYGGGGDAAGGMGGFDHAAAGGMSQGHEGATASSNKRVRHCLLVSLASGC